MFEKESAPLHGVALLRMEALGFDLDSAEGCLLCYAVLNLVQ
jgi:hypothetical protein